MAEEPNHPALDADGHPPLDGDGHPPLDGDGRPPLEAVPDCRACAACCAGGHPRFVPVTGDDYQRIGAAAATWTTFLGNRCYMRMRDGRCAALTRDPGSGLWLCGIYDARPQVCRDLERGSPVCAAERWRKMGGAAAGA